MKTNFMTIGSRLAFTASIVLASVLITPGYAAGAGQFDVTLWPNGEVPFRFADADDRDRWGLAARRLSSADQELVMWEMFFWQTALTIRDPFDQNQSKAYIQFVSCGADRCAQKSDTGYVLIRYNSLNSDGSLKEKNNMCSWYDGAGHEHVGRNPAGGATVLHFAAGNDGNTIRHELGHCLGLWHEFSRSDRDYWLDEQPDADTAWEWDEGEVLGQRFPDRGPTLMPELGNYDYDSIMHYGSYRQGCDVRWKDLLGNMFDRHGLDSPPTPINGNCENFPTGLPALAIGDRVSARDKSRLLQYYARERQSNWGFFESLNKRPLPYDYDGRIDPYLAPGVSARGTPAVAFQSQDTYDVFVRGSDERMYWKRFRRLPFEPELAEFDWVSLGCCFGSDPAAISRADGHIDLFAIGAISGRPTRVHYANGVWGQWLYVRDDNPLGGIKGALSGGGFIGPGVASRSAASMDVFVVRADGLLAVSTLNNGAWSSWRTLDGLYNVTARPAALALTTTTVQLAINSDNTKLFEPLVTFAAGQAPTLNRGNRTAWTASQAAPALTARADSRSPYRVLITTPDRRIGHRFAGGAWRDIGGIPLSGTGVSAVASGSTSALTVMNGEDVFGCARTCLASSPQPNKFIQPGGVWLRRFN